MSTKGKLEILKKVMKDLSKLKESSSTGVESAIDRSISRLNNLARMINKENVEFLKIYYTKLEEESEWKWKITKFSGPGASEEQKSRCHAIICRDTLIFENPKGSSCKRQTYSVGDILTDRKLSLLEALCIGTNAKMELTKEQN